MLITYGTGMQGCGSGSALVCVAGSGSSFNMRIRIWIQEGKIDPKKRQKKRNFMFGIAGCFGAEGFSYSLGVLYRGLRISKLQFDQKNFIFQLEFFILFLVIKILDTELDPDPQLNQCGSATLQE
jgi:hypothetical protein